MLILAGLALFVPIFDGYSISDLGDQCRAIQQLTGFLSIFGIGDGTIAECVEVHQVTLAIYGFGAIGLIILVVGAVVRR